MVPPFANDSGDPALNSFAKGITEEVIGGLIGFENVLVFGGSKLQIPLRTLRRHSAPPLRASTLAMCLTGRISRAGNQIQINVTLLQAADNQYFLVRPLLPGIQSQQYDPGLCHSS